MINDRSRSNLSNAVLRGYFDSAAILIIPRIVGLSFFYNRRRFMFLFTFLRESAGSDAGESNIRQRTLYMALYIHFRDSIDRADDRCRSHLAKIKKYF